MCSWCTVPRSSFRFARMLVFACAFCIQAPAAEEQPKSNNQDPKNEPFRPLAGEFPPLEKSHGLPWRTDLRGPCQPPRQHPGAERWEIPVHPSEPLRDAAVWNRPLSWRTGRSPGCSAGDDDARPRLPPAGPETLRRARFANQQPNEKRGQRRRRLSAGRESRSAFGGRTQPLPAHG